MESHVNSASSSASNENALSALRESERRFRAISACTYDWESWHDPSGRLQWVNAAVARITGYSVEECLAMPEYPLPIAMPSDRPKLAEVMESAAAGVCGNDVEFRLQTRKGQERWGAISWQSIFDDDGVNMGFRTSVRDIADRKRLEQEIRNYAENLEELVQERTVRLMELEDRRAKLDRLAALGQLAAGVAHEINNPLAGIRNAVELIRDSLPQDFDGRPLLNLVQSEIDRMGGIIRQLYQLHRPQPAVDVETDLVRVISQTTELLAASCRRQRVEIHFCDRPFHPVTAQVPENDLKQVLYNVLLNAVQASPAGTAVDVTLAVQKDRIGINITDCGAGIPRDVLPKIFDPFFTTKHGSAQPGLGLGLSISQSLIQAMGGRIEVDVSISRQTTFSVVLPVASRPPSRR